MNAQKAIEQLGYKPQEVRVYLALLRVGESTASYVADRVRLPRTSVRVILERLHEDGLISFYTKKRYTYWMAEDPEKLASLCHEKADAIQKVLPELTELRRSVGERPVIKVFIGANEIKHMQWDMIESRQHIAGILSWVEWIDLFGKEYIDDFIETREKHFLTLRMLTPYSDTAERFRKSDKQHLRETKYLPKRIAINTSTFIYANKVAIIALNKKQPTGILIADADVHLMMQEIFEELWRIST